MSLRITVLLLALTIGLTTASKAAFVINKETKTEQTGNSQAVSLTTIDENILPSETTVSAEPAARATAAPTFGKPRISKLAYILLSVFLLGFLAVGLNDYFKGSSWIICLCLCLLYVPGLIYALVTMKKFYHNKNKSFRY